MTGDKLPVIWSVEAKDDLFGIWISLARTASPKVADNQLRDIDRAIAMLEMWSFAGKSRDELGAALRSVPIQPNNIFYRPTPSSLQIVRVVDGRRNLDTLFGD